MFPDSKMAGAYAAARTKTRAIITHALAIKLMISVQDACQCGPFTILCDGSNNQLDGKFFPILVWYCDHSERQAVTRFSQSLYAILLLQ